MVNYREYTLKWTSGEITTTQYTLYAIQIAVVILLSWLGVVLTPVVGPGIGFLYWAYPFFIVFTWWWGLWGVISAFIGCFIGAGLLTGLPLIPSLAFSVGDFVPALLVLLLYRGYLNRIGIDPLGRDILSNKKALFWFIFWVMGITNIFGGLWGVWVLVWLGFVPPNAYWLGASLWIIGDAIVLIIAPFLSRALTPIVERYGLVAKGLIS
ncbi:MAG: hypothetical protein QW246_05005 [Thermoplasmata archaeon]